MLITVTGTVSNESYSCAVDGSCSDTGLWEIGGSTGVVVYDRMYSGSDWTSQKGSNGETVTVTGVMGYRFSRRRLQPRSSADF